MRFALILSLIMCTFTASGQMPNRNHQVSRIPIEGMTPAEVVQVAGKPFSEDITLIGGKPFRRWIYKGTTFDTGRQILDRTVVNYEVLFFNGTVYAVLRHTHD